MDKAGGIEATTFDLRAADGTSIAYGSTAPGRLGHGPRFDRRPHHVRAVRRRAPEEVHDVRDRSPRLRWQRRRTWLRHRTGLRGRRHRRRRRRRPHGWAGQRVRPLLWCQLRNRRRRPHRQHSSPRALRAELRTALPGRLDRGHRGGPREGRQRRGHRRRAHRDPEDDGRGDRPDAAQARCGRCASLPHRRSRGKAESRRSGSYETRSVRRDHAADTDAGRLREHGFDRRGHRRVGPQRFPMSGSTSSKVTATSPTRPTRRWSRRSSRRSSPRDPAIALVDRFQRWRRVP